MARDEQPGDGTADPRRSGRVVIVGAMTRDVFEDRESLGGAVAYAARVASAFGYRARVLTIGAAKDAAGAAKALGGHEVRWLESGSTLTFRHRFNNGARELTLLARPDRPLTRDDLPSEWADTEVLVLAPLLPDDIDVPSFRDLAGTRERALIAQGLLRQAVPDEPVRMAEGYPYALFGATSPETSVFLSDEDIAGWPRAAMEAVWSASRRVIVTRGERGAEVRTGLRRFHVQAMPNAGPVVDTTGAGDVFATALILALVGGSSDEEAAQIASAYAAANIEHEGPAALPPLDEVCRRVGVAAAAGPGRQSG